MEPVESAGFYASALVYDLAPLDELNLSVSVEQTTQQSIGVQINRRHTAVNESSRTPLPLLPNLNRPAG